MHDMFNGLCDAVKQQYIQCGSPRMSLHDDIAIPYGMTDEDMIRHWNATHSILVWTGASEHTIYGDPYVNWMFRAWHDMCHMNSGVCNREHGELGCFEVSAEHDVARYQCKGLSDLLAQVVQLEVVGQATHWLNTGQFIQDQRAWTLVQLKGT